MHSHAGNCVQKIFPGVGVLLTFYTSTAFAQHVPTEPAVVASGSNSPETLVIATGVRASLATAQGIKQDKIEITDSVVAEDINKLPDFNVTDALQRVTGVQILRDRGEGAGVAIRGLTQMETLLNGREVFTAGWGRNLDFADIPSEMLAGIDVYKTSSASQVEGGVGGTVDLRTHRPFDFNGRKVVAAVRQIHGDLVGESRPQFSTLLSDRWALDHGGEFGALVNLAYQERSFREDQKSAGAPVARTNTIVAGQTVFVPNGTTETTSRGVRKRTSGNVVLQWRLSPAVEYYAEGSYAEFTTAQNSYQISSTAPAAAVPGSVMLFPGTKDVQHVTWTNAAITTAGAARDTIDHTVQLAAGGKWTLPELTLNADLSYTRSHNNLMYSALVMNGTAATLTQDLSGNIPATSVGGSNLLSQASYSTSGIWYALRPFDGDLKTFRLDAEYPLYGEIIESLSGGLRIARRHATDAPGQVGFFPATVPVANASSLAIANPYSNFFPGSQSIGNYRLGNPDAARSVNNLCATLGIACAIPASNPLGTWNINENTTSGYLMGKFNAAAWALDGNAGLRVVHTGESVDGNLGPAAGPYTPIGIRSNYTDYLPSVNVRHELSKGLYLRGAASKTITRQDFNQISPSLTLNPVLHTGSAGNPELRPVRSQNLDLAVEKYFDASTSVHSTFFMKKVDGFVQTVVNPEVWGGVSYNVTRPYNLNTAHVYGAELGYQQFYDNLPGWLKGLGMQANFTWVASNAYDPVLRQKAMLSNLSPRSYNLVGMYERGAASARIAYNWRDKFLSGTANVAGVGQPVYTKSYGWLDASFSYRFDKEFTVALEGTNLLRTVRSSYYGVESRPQNYFINDRQLSVTATARF